MSHPVPVAIADPSLKGWPTAQRMGEGIGQVTSPSEPAEDHQIVTDNDPNMRQGLNEDQAGVMMAADPQHQAALRRSTRMPPPRTVPVRPASRKVSWARSGTRFPSARSAYHRDLAAANRLHPVLRRGAPLARANSPVPAFGVAAWYDYRYWALNARSLWLDHLNRVVGCVSAMASDGNDRSGVVGGSALR